MTNFDAMILSLTRSNNTWNCPNWEYSGIKDIHPSLEGLSVKEQLKVMVGLVQSLTKLSGLNQDRYQLVIL